MGRKKRLRGCLLKEMKDVRWSKVYFCAHWTTGFVALKIFVMVSVTTCAIQYIDVVYRPLVLIVHSH